MLRQRAKRPSATNFKPIAVVGEGEPAVKLMLLLFLLPLAMIVGFAWAVPGAVGILAGVVAAVLYYAVTILRASDWR